MPLRVCCFLLRRDLCQPGGSSPCAWEHKSPRPMMVNQIIPRCTGSQMVPKEWEGTCWHATKSFRYLKWRYKTTKGYFGCGFSLTYVLRTAYIGEYLHFRYLKCLVIHGLANGNKMDYWTITNAIAPEKGRFCFFWKTFEWLHLSGRFPIWSRYLKTWPYGNLRGRPLARKRRCISGRKIYRPGNCLTDTSHENWWLEDAFSFKTWFLLSDLSVNFRGYWVLYPFFLGGNEWLFSCSFRLLEIPGFFAMHTLVVFSQTKKWPSSKTFVEVHP